MIGAIVGDPKMADGGGAENSEAERADLSQCKEKCHQLTNLQWMCVPL